MKYLKNFTGVLCASLMVMSLAFAFSSCSNDDDNNNTTGVFTFSSNSVEVITGKTATVSVSGGTAPYTVSTGDAKIATAQIDKSNITVTGVKDGSTSLIVTDKNKNVGKIFIVVKNAAASLTFDKSSVSIAKDKEDVVTVSGGTVPYTATVKDAAIATATVKDAKVTVKGLKAGTTTITVADKDKKYSGVISVTIK
jgi:predicted regulator of Ras-like GTPase activity (Roadblock/LC7/MglB family)